MKVRNAPTDVPYIISVIATRKRVTIPLTIPLSDDVQVSLSPMRFDHLTLEAAVYEQKSSFFRQILSKPVLVVNLNDPGGHISTKEFSNLMCNLVENERIEDLLDETRSNEIYKWYRFESVDKQIWSLLHLRRINHTFIFRTPEVELEPIGAPPMYAVCKNSACPLSYDSHDGRLVLELIRVLKNNQYEGAATTSAAIERLRTLAPRIYQTGPNCSNTECGILLARLPSPTEPLDVNDLLENIEFLQIYGVF
jgi:hypothetical protein